MKIWGASAKQKRTSVTQTQLSARASQEQSDFQAAIDFLCKAEAETRVEKAALEEFAEKCAKEYENYLRQKGGFLTKYNPFKYNPFSPEDDKLKKFRGDLKRKTNIESKDGEFAKTFGKKQLFKTVKEQNEKEYEEKLNSFQKQLEEFKRKSSQQPALQPTEDAQNQDSSVHSIKERYQDSYWHTNSQPLTDSDSGSTTSAKDLVSSHSDPSRQNDYRLDADFHNKITSKLSVPDSTADLTSDPQTTDFDAEIQATKDNLKAYLADSSPDSTSNPNQVNLALKLCVLEAAKESGLTKQEFSKFVLNAKHVGGVGNPKKTDNPSEEGEKDKAIEFSFVFQEKTKVLGIYTGRQRADKVNDENWYKSFGLRLTFLPAEVLLDLSGVKEVVSEKIDSADVLTPPPSPAPPKPAAAPEAPPAPETLPPTPPVSPKPESGGGEPAAALSTEAGKAAPVPVPPEAGAAAAALSTAGGGEAAAALSPAAAEPPPVSPVPPEAGAAAVPAPPAAAAVSTEAGAAAASLRSRLAAASAAETPASPDSVKIEVAGGYFGPASADPVVMPGNWRSKVTSSNAGGSQGGGDRVR